MTKHPFYKAYAASVCVLPAVCLAVYPLAFSGAIKHFPFSLLYWVNLYFWLGLVVVLVDLWKSSLPKDKKVVWFVLNVFVGLVALPVY